MKREELLAQARELTPSEMVEQFQTTYKAGLEHHPTVPAVDVMRLRCVLIEEEFKEFYQACAEGNLVEAADALGDLLYVVLGGFCVFGIGGNNGAEIMAQIHASNMSKLCFTKDEAQDFIDDTTTKDGPIYYMEENDAGQFVLYWASGEKKDKVAKGPNYFKPDLSFLKEYDAKTKEV